MNDSYSGEGSLPVNAMLLQGAEELTDPTRKWYFSVLVRAAMTRMVSA